MTRNPDEEISTIYKSQLESQLMDIGKKKGKGSKSPKGLKKGKRVKLMEYTAQFEYEKSTKNKHRYQELSDDPIVGALYVSKTALKGKPRKLEVNIRVVG